MSYYRQGPNRPGGIGFSVPGLTPYVKILIIVCVAVWLVQFIANLMFGQAFVISGILGLVPAWVVGQGPGGIPALWQLFTYMFLHSPGVIFHILFNMLMLWLFGAELERYWGSRSFLRYYLVCGVGAGVLATIMGLTLGNPQSITIGASGAIYGLMIAYGIIFAHRTILFMMIFPMKAWVFAAILFVLAFFSTIGTGPSDGVSHVAHLGGAITGYLYLNRAWRIGEFFRDLRWKLRRRKFRVMPPEDPDDRWLN